MAAKVLQTDLHSRYQVRHSTETGRLPGRKLRTEKRGKEMTGRYGKQPVGESILRRINLYLLLYHIKRSVQNGKEKNRIAN